MTIISGILILTAGLAFRIFGGTTDDGWSLLTDNKPNEARTSFETQLANPDPVIRGSALRGLAAVSKFTGSDDEAMSFTFRSFLADNDTIIFNSQWINVMNFGRTGAGRNCEPGYRAMARLTSKNSLFNGESRSVYADRLVNDGKLKKAGKIVKSLGAVRSFMMAGPFENISGSGFNCPYQPEQNISFSETFKGKDGALVSWHPFFNSARDGWVFTENNYRTYHAALYYFSNIKSDQNREVWLGFGASGAFKVFLNDNLVLADSVFRNTGTDMFMQKVRLFAGSNKLLIKICHESSPSNFLIRFCSSNGAAIKGVSCSTTAETFTRDTVSFASLDNSPVMDRIERRLLKLLEIPERHPEAAILLMDLYNAAERTEKGQKLAKNMTQRYPGSSIWHSLYSESLMRSRKTTEAQTEMKTAFRLCNLNKTAWESELGILSSTAGAREILDFIDNSPLLFGNSVEALVAKLAQYIESGNETETMKTLTELERLYSGSGRVAELLSAFYGNRGDTRRAASLLSKMIHDQRSFLNAYEQLAEIYLKMGNRLRTVSLYKKSLKYLPVSPDAFHFLSRLYFQLGENTTAIEYAEAALHLRPSSSALLNLKGAILAALGKKQDAAGILRQSIASDYNNFSAWDQLLPLEGSSPVSSLVMATNPDSVIAASAQWKDMNGENGSVLAYVNDLFFYPSRCSRERNFMMVCVPTQNAIDIWKEYSISFNSNYQKLNVTKAYSRGMDGRETPADVDLNLVVFKSLKPGDFIVLEWMLDNYYNSGMAGYVWGEFSFDLPFPVFMSSLRLVTPNADTIPFRIQGDSVSISTRNAASFRITEFLRKPYRNPPAETFMLSNPPSMSKVSYSTFKSWSDIADWYSNLTENKLEQTSELKAVADSILAEAENEAEKVRRIHSFITNSIRYSYMPFRQSAWIPQPAREVLATRIGDCKDMSSIAKSFFDYAGIKSSLVLVNTRGDNSAAPSYIGPDFNHCIISYTEKNERKYLDMTDNNLSASGIPKGDQGAPALIIERGFDSLIHLPVDSPSARKTFRTLVSKISADGTLSAHIKTVRTGILAGELRSTYRFLPAQERSRMLQKILSEVLPGVKIDTAEFGCLDSLNDTLEYSYGYTAKNAAGMSANTAIVPLNLPDRIDGHSYPGEEDRHYDIDMVNSWFDIGDFSMEGSLTIPEGWKPITLPPQLRYSSEFGEYSLSFSYSDSILRFSRKAVFNFRTPIPAAESADLREYLSRIARADNVQLLFFTGLK